MNARFMTVLIAGIDIWAVLFIVHYRPTPTWEATVVTNGNQQTTQLAGASKPVEIWVADDQSIGLWPERSKPISMEQMQAYLQRLRDEGQHVEVRLLCDRSLTLERWGRVAIGLGSSVDEIRVAPLPSEGPAAAGR